MRKKDDVMIRHQTTNLPSVVDNKVAKVKQHQHHYSSNDPRVHLADNKCDTKWPATPRQIYNDESQIADARPVPESPCWYCQQLSGGDME